MSLVMCITGLRLINIHAILLVSSVSLSLLYRPKECFKAPIEQLVSKARFPLPELTARVNGPLTQGRQLG